MHRSPTATRAIFLSASVIPLAWVVGQCVGQVFKHFNPNKVDINNGLAYLPQVLIAGLGTMVLCLLAAFFSIRRAATNGEEADAKLALQLLGGQVGLLLFTAVISLIFRV